MQHVTLFKEIEADLDGPAPYAMPAAEYLRRSKRPESHRIREFLNGCFCRYPQAHRDELKRRLLLLDNRQHSAAVFELVMHEFLLRSGSNVEVHPELGSGRSKHPDYLVRCGDEPKFMLELALATEASDQASGTGKLFASVYDAVNRVRSPDFFLWLQKSGSPDAELNKRRLTNQLTAWLRSLNYDDFPGNTKPERLPRYTYIEKGLELEFIAIPKSPEARGNSAGRILASTGVTAQWSRTAPVLESTLKKKITKYGRHDLPYIVAANALTTTIDADEIMQALLGPVKIPVDFFGDEPSVGQAYREPGGVWLDKTGSPINQRLSGALIVHGLQAWNLGKVRWTLYHNPWPLHALPPGLLNAPQVEWSAGQPKHVRGAELWEALDLWETWPETEMSLQP